MSSSRIIGFPHIKLSDTSACRGWCQRYSFSWKERAKVYFILSLYYSLTHYIIFIIFWTNAFNIWMSLKDTEGFLIAWVEECLKCFNMSKWFKKNIVSSTYFFFRTYRKSNCQNVIQVKMRENTINCSVGSNFLLRLYP